MKMAFIYSTQWYIKRLENENIEVRVKAAQKLGERRNPRAIDPLINALYQINAEAQTAALRALEKFGDLVSTESLLRCLSSSDLYVCKYTFDALSKSTDKRIVDLLVDKLSDYEYATRRNAAKILSEIGGEQATNIFINLMSDQDFNIARTAAWYISKLGDERAINPLIELLSMQVAYYTSSDLYGVWEKEHFSFSNNYSSELLASFGEKAFKVLIDRLSDNNENVRKVVVHILEQLGDKRAVKPLIKCLYDENNLVKQAAAEALGTIGDKRAIEHLTEIVLNPIKELSVSKRKYFFEILNEIYTSSEPFTPKELKDFIWHYLWEMEIQPQDISNLTVYIPPLIGLGGNLMEYKSSIVNN